MVSFTNVGYFQNSELLFILLDHAIKARMF